MLRFNQKDRISTFALFSFLRKIMNVFDKEI